MLYRKLGILFLLLHVLAAVFSLTGTWALYHLSQIPDWDYTAVTFWLGIANVLTGVLSALLLMAYREGWKPALTLLALCTVLAGGMELLGTTTGFPFGSYTYTDLLGPKFLGHVPYLIPPSWMMMLYPAMMLTELLLPQRERHHSHPSAMPSVSEASHHIPGARFFASLRMTIFRCHAERSEASLSTIIPKFLASLRMTGHQEQDTSIRRISLVPLLRPAVAGLILTIWDFAMDPAMTTGFAYWQWHTEGGFYGMPYVNWFGWWLTGTLVAAAFWKLHREWKGHWEPFALALYLIQGAFMAGLAWLYLRPLASLWWLVSVGVLMWLVWRRRRRQALSPREAQVWHTSSW